MSNTQLNMVSRKQNVCITINVPYVMQRMGDNYNRVTQSIHRRTIAGMYDNEFSKSWEESFIAYHVEQLRSDRKKIDSYISSMEKGLPYYMAKKYHELTSSIDELITSPVVMEIC